MIELVSFNLKKIICAISVISASVAPIAIGATESPENQTPKRKRSYTGAFLFLAMLLLGGTSVHAQKRDTSWLDKGPLRWLLVEKSFGLLPEIDFVNGGMGLNICRGKFIRGTQRAMAGNGYYAGVAYDTDHKITSAGFGAWIGMFKRKFGGQAGIKGVFYFGKDAQVFAFRPEAGIGFPKAQLSYGYNIFTEKTELQLATHTLTLYVYFGLHSSRTALF